MNTVQALLIVICALSVPISIFFLSDKLSARKRAKRTERALTKQTLFIAMKNATEIDLTAAVRVLNAVGIRARVVKEASNDLQIILPEFFWEAATDLLIAQSLITVVKDAGIRRIGHGHVANWVFPLCQQLIIKAKSDPLLVISVVMEISRLDRELAEMMIPIIPNRGL